MILLVMFRVLEVGNVERVCEVVVVVNFVKVVVCVLEFDLEKDESEESGLTAFGSFSKVCKLGGIKSLLSRKNTKPFKCDCKLVWRDSINCKEKYFRSITTAMSLMK